MIISNTLYPQSQLNREERYEAARSLISDTCREWFDAEGNWIHPIGVNSEGAWINPPQPIPKTYTRLAFWICMGLLCGNEDDVRLGNAILEKAKFHSHNIPEQPGLSKDQIPPFDIFVTNHSMQMLVLHGDKLSESVKRKIEFWASAGLRDYMGNRQADLQFHGFNDNMPAKATLGLVLGGEYFEDRTALEHGLWNLHQLSELLTRRGLISEYNSPTYTPFTLVNLTVVSQYAKSAKARALASQCCERIWAEILASFHRPTGLMGGPYSRSYHFDSVGHLSTQSFLLWLALDDMVLPNPIETFRNKPVTLLHAHGFVPESLSRLSWVSSCDLRPPSYLQEWAHAREYPFNYQASTERGNSNADKHCSEVKITQYQEEDFCLGTAEGETWSQLQSEVFYLNYRKSKSVSQREDIRVAYTHYLINDEAPRDPKESLPNHGVIHTIQDKRNALVLARPAMNCAEKDIHKLRLCLLIPEHFGQVDHIDLVNNHVFIEDGPVRYAIRALNPSDWGGAKNIHFERCDNYLLISMENYNGEPRTFSQEELGRTMSGFAFTIALKEEETAEAFRQRVLAAQCLDFWYFGARTVRYKNEETQLEINYAVDNDHVKYACINGRIRQSPIWKADGLPAESLPFLQADQAPAPIQFPFKHMNVHWDKNTIWTVGSNVNGSGCNHVGSGWRRFE